MSVRGLVLLGWNILILYKTINGNRLVCICNFVSTILKFSYFIVIHWFYPIHDKMIKSGMPLNADSDDRPQTIFILIGNIKISKHASPQPLNIYRMKYLYVAYSVPSIYTDSLSWLLNIFLSVNYIQYVQLLSNSSKYFS